MSATCCLAAGLAACGGGGGGGAAPAPTGTGSPPPVLQFTNATNSTGIDFVHGIANGPSTMPEMFGGGVASGDYDNDGDTDLFVVRGNVGPNLLYRNDGGNRFTDVASAAGVAETNPGGGAFRHSGPTFADMDGDGDLDLFIGGLEGDPSLIYENNGDGTFRDVSMSSGIAAMSAVNTISAAFGDFDLDGDLDLMLAHWGTPRPPDGQGGYGDTESLWRNDSDAAGIRFTGVSIATGVAPAMIARRGGLDDFGADALDYDYSFSPTFARMDDDQYPDILSVADFNNTRLFISRGSRDPLVTFDDRTDNAVVIDRNGMGSAVGDFDNDGDLDWFVTGIFGVGETVGNRLYRNDGDGGLQDVTVVAGVADGGWGWAACFADFNLDGHLDLFHTNGWDNPNALDDFENDQSRLFISQGNGTFVDEADERGMTDTQQGRGVVCADFDADGDVDIFMTNRGLQNSGAFWLNEDPASMNNSLTVKLVGLAPNTEAANARIRVTTGGLTQLREVMIGSNFTSQNPTEQIFGLGSATTVDTVEIEWPGGGTTELGSVQANQRLEIRHPAL